MNIYFHLVQLHCLVQVNALNQLASEFINPPDNYSGTAHPINSKHTKIQNKRYYLSMKAVSTSSQTLLSEANKILIVIFKYLLWVADSTGQTTAQIEKDNIT